MGSQRYWEESNLSNWSFGLRFRETRRLGKEMKESRNLRTFSSSKKISKISS